MNPNESCGFYLKQLHDALEKGANNALRSQDITMAQMGALLFLGERPGHEASMKELEKSMKIAQSTTAGIVSRLERKGFVAAFGSPDDKRIKMVRITPEGEAICRDSLQHMTETEDRLLKGFTDVERTVFRELLKKSCDNMK